MSRQRLSDDEAAFMDAVETGGYEAERPPGYQKSLDTDYGCCRYCETVFETESDERNHLCQGRLDVDFDADVGPELLEPAVHESEWKFTFASEGMSAYWAIVSQYDLALHNDVTDFHVEGERWQIITSERVEEDDRLDEEATGDDAPAVTRHWEGAIRAENQEFDTFNEYQISLRADDEVFERKVTVQFKPSMPDMIYHESGEPIKSVPSGLPEGVRVQVNAANVNPDEILDIMQSLADALDINVDYFTEDALARGKGSQLAIYVRPERGPAKSLVTQGGVLERIAHLGTGVADASGEFSWDNTGVEGHRTAVEATPEVWNRLIPGQQLGKRVKHYHREHATGLETDDVTTAPKVEVQFSPKLNNGYIDWDDRDTVQAELEDALLNVLHWGDVPIGGPNYRDVYRTDDPYFDVVSSDRDRTVIEDPTEELVGAEQDLAVDVYGDAQLTPKRQEILEYVLDGGGQRYDDLVEQVDASVSTVYRTVRSLPHVLQADGGMVDFIDRAVRERMEQFFSAVRGLSATVQDDVAELVEYQEAAEYADTALGRWMQAHGVQLFEGERSDDIGVDLRSVKRGWSRVRQILRSGVVAASSSSVSARRILDGRVRWIDGLGDEHDDRVADIVDRIGLEEMLTWELDPPAAADA